MEILVKLIMVAVLVVTLAIWAIVGLVFWIPLLMRATTVFAAALVPAAFSHRGISQLHDGLQNASGFYFRGFKYAFDAFNDEPDGSSEPLRLGRVLLEMLWTAAFWFFLLVVIKPTFREVALSLWHSIK